MKKATWFWLLAFLVQLALTVGSGFAVKRSNERRDAQLEEAYRQLRECEAQMDRCLNIRVLNGRRVVVGCRSGELLGVMP